MKDSGRDDSAPSWAPALWILALALVAGLYDLVLGIKGAGRGFEPHYLKEFGLPVLRLVVLGVGAAIGGMWLLLGWPLARWARLRRSPLVGAFAVFLGAVGFFAAEVDPFRTSDLRRTVVDLTRLALVGVLPAVVFYQWFAAGTARRRRLLETWLVRGSLALAAVAALYWAVVYLPGSDASVVWWVLALAAAAVAVAGLTALRERAGALVALLSLFVLVAPYLPWPDSSLRIEGEGRAKTPGKVILLTVDTLRADSLSPYGADASQSPNIEAFAGESVVFENPVSAGNWTLPGTASLLTGLSVSVHEVKRLHFPLSESIDTLAEYLERLGMVTAGIGGNPHLSSPELQFDQGFDRYYFLPMSYGGSMGGKVYTYLAHSERTTGPSTGWLTRQAVDWLRANHDQDFFLWLHYFDPHLGYEPPPAYLPEGDPGRVGDEVLVRVLRKVRIGEFVPNKVDRERIRALYDAEVRLIDDAVGEVFAELRELGIYDETIVVLSSDHGEEIFEHGGFEHGHTVYEELTKVPLIIKGAGMPAGTRVAEPVATEGVLPTVLEMLGVPFDERRFTGIALGPVARGEVELPSVDVAEGETAIADVEAEGEAVVDIEAADEETIDEVIVSQGALYYQPQIAVRMGRYKYIVDLIGGEEELYDLEQDPGETHSLVRDLPEIVERMKRALAAHEEGAKRLQKSLDIEIESIELTDETIEQLRSLGYMN